MIDLHLKIDGKEKLMTKLYNKRDDFSFRIVNSLSICGNILSAPMYGNFMSQLIRYTRAFRNYADFSYGVRPLTIRLLEQGYVATKIRSSIQSFMIVIMNSGIVIVYQYAP